VFYITVIVKNFVSFEMFCNELEDSSILVGVNTI